MTVESWCIFVCSWWESRWRSDCFRWYIHWAKNDSENIIDLLNRFTVIFFFLLLCDENIVDIFAYFNPHFIPYISYSLFHYNSDLLFFILLLCYFQRKSFSIPWLLPNVINSSYTTHLKENCLEGLWFVSKGYFSSTPPKSSEPLTHHYRKGSHL